jgi:hypothetical protein
MNACVHAASFLPLLRSAKKDFRCNASARCAPCAEDGRHLALPAPACRQTGQTGGIPLSASRFVIDVETVKQKSKKPPALILRRDFLIILLEVNHVDEIRLRSL